MISYHNNRLCTKMWSFSSTAIKSQHMSHKCLWGIASVAFNSIWELWNWYQDPLLYMLLIIQQFEIFHKFLMKINTFRKYDQVQQHILLEPQNFWQHKTKCIQQIHIVIHLKSKKLKTNDFWSQHIKNSWNNLYISSMPMHHLFGKYNQAERNILLFLFKS